MIPIKHKKGLHPQIKKHFDFSNDRFGWYWIYFSNHIFNTYEWYIAKATKNYVVWKNYYYDEEDSPIILTKFKSIKKVICWKCGPYSRYNWNLIDEKQIN